MVKAIFFFFKSLGQLFGQINGQVNCQVNYVTKQISQVNCQVNNLVKKIVNYCDFWSILVDYGRN